MMKLIWMIVQDEDAPKLMDALVEHRFGVTKMASSGGFLRKGNTVLMVGVRPEELDQALLLVEQNCERRERITPVSGMPPGEVDFMPMPSKVEVGGAVCFIVDCDLRKY
jgi:uncharacterized protein YaaQ